MTMNRNSLLSGLLAFTILATSVVPAFPLVDEGMYMPDKIATIRDLRKRGLKLRPEEIYNRAGEISAKGYSIYITERSEDVTAKINVGGTPPTGDALATAIKNVTESEQAKAPAGSIVRIQT